MGLFLSLSADICSCNITKPKGEAKYTPNPFFQFPKNKKMETEILDRLEKIEQFTMLGAKQALTMDDAALLTGLSKSTLYKMVCQKKIPYYKSQGGKFTYFERESLNNWMLNVRVATAEETDQTAATYLATGKMGGN
jgi:excisionase family DNA binding protein